jgi:hypothetical protein
VKTTRRKRNQRAWLFSNSFSIGVAVNGLQSLPGKECIPSMSVWTQKCLPDDFDIENTLCTALGDVFRLMLCQGIQKAEESNFEMKQSSPARCEDPTTDFGAGLEAWGYMPDHQYFNLGCVASKARRHESMSKKFF